MAEKFKNSGSGRNLCVDVATVALVLGLPMSCGSTAAGAAASRPRIVDPCGTAAACGIWPRIMVPGSDAAGSGSWNRGTDPGTDVAGHGSWPRCMDGHVSEKLPPTDVSKQGVPV